MPATALGYSSDNVPLLTALLQPVINHKHAMSDTDFEQVPDPPMLDEAQMSLCPPRKLLGHH